MIDYKSLVLNSDYTPLNYFPLSVIDWKIGFKLIFLEKVDVIEYYNKKIHSVNKTFFIPSIVIIKKYVKKPEFAKFTKYNIFLRDDFTCAYCHENFYNRMYLLTCDHVIPRSKGGKSTWTNLITACADCNSRKGDKIRIPKKKPYVPTYFDLLTKRKKYPLVIYDENWKPFLNWPEDKIIVRQQ